jgi:hypothetical protein
MAEAKEGSEDVFGFGLGGVQALDAAVGETCGR